MRSTNILLASAIICLPISGAGQVSNHPSTNFDLPNATVNDCVALDKMSEDDVLSYVIAQQRSASDLTCYSASFKRLTRGPSDNAIEVIVELLDYAFPDVPDRTTLPLLHLPRPYERFPAVWALEAIGRAAVPKINAYLSRGTTSELGRQNAINALELIYMYAAPRRDSFYAQVKEITDRAKQLPAARGTLVADLASLDQKYVRGERSRGNTHTDEVHWTTRPGTDFSR